MELAEFVEKSLLGITTGISNAQKKLGQTGGVGQVNPHDIIGALQEDVEFDVAVTAAQSEAGKGQAGAGIRVIGLGVHGEMSSESKNSVATRLRFKIPVYYP